MVHLLFVLDGPRDDVMIPVLVEKIIDSPIQHETIPWKDKHLHRGGYGRKFLMATRRAKDKGMQGIVSVVDRDNDEKGKRLQKLKTARKLDRERRPPFPTALGEANPHGEAWLLDDAVAIRQSLQLSETVSIPSVKRTPSPKKSVDELIEQNRTGDKSHMDILSDIAQSVDPVRYANAKTTGFSDFRSEVMSEIAPLVNNT